MPSRPDLRATLPKACALLVGCFALLLYLAWLITQFLHSDVAQDVDAALLAFGEAATRSARASSRQRGRFNASGPTSWSTPADCNATFLRLVRQRTWQAHVLRRPTPLAGRSGNWGSWMVVLDNFTTAEEAQALIEAVGGDWRREETGSGARRSDTFRCDGVDARRCAGRAEVARLVRALSERVQAAVGISTAYFDETYLVRYRPGDGISEHHDTPPAFSRQHRVRMLTALLHLSEMPEGGETAFPRLRAPRDAQALVVRPRVGRLVVWPNIRDGRPAEGVADMRMVHEGRVVTRGTKYSANIWVGLQRRR